MRAESQRLQLQLFWACAPHPDIAKAHIGKLGRIDLRAVPANVMHRLPCGAQRLYIEAVIRKDFTMAEPQLLPFFRSGFEAQNAGEILTEIVNPFAVRCLKDLLGL